MKLEVGNPVKMISPVTMGEETLEAGTIGVVNALATMPTNAEGTEHAEFVWFMPHNQLKSYVFLAERVELLTDEEADELGIAEWDIPEEA